MKKSKIRAINRENDINYLLIEVIELQYQIKKCHSVIKALEKEKELQKIYAEEIMPLVWDYDRIIEELGRCLEEHFLWEKENNVPTDLNYQKLSRVIKAH